MFYFFNKNEELIKIINDDKAAEAFRTERINAPCILNLSILEKPSEDAWFVGHKDVINQNELCFYKIQSIKAIDEQWEIVATENAFDELAVDGIVKDYSPQNKSISGVAEKILEGSRWKLDKVNVSGKVTSNFYYKTRIQSLMDLAEKAGIEYRFRMTFSENKIQARFVDIYKEIGEDRGKRYYHGGNLLKVIATESRDEIYTALIGRGKGEEIFDENSESTGGYGRRINFEEIEWKKSKGDPVDKPKGQDYIEIPEMTKIFGLSNGKPRLGIVEFGDIEDREELLKATYEHLVDVSRPITTYKADVLDKGDTELGETVAIIRKDLGIQYKTRIFEREVNLLQPEKVSIKLGDKIEDYTQKQLSNLNKKIDNNDLAVTTKINQALEVALANFWGEDGYNYDLKIGNEYNLPAGLYSFDKPIDQNPTEFIYVGAGKMVISNHKNADGSWDVRTIADGNGVIADAIVTGIINSSNGVSSLNLDNGSFKLGNDFYFRPGSGLEIGNFVVNTDGAMETDSYERENYTYTDSDMQTIESIVRGKAVPTAYGYKIYNLNSTEDESEEGRALDIADMTEVEYIIRGLKSKTRTFLNKIKIDPNNSKITLSLRRENEDGRIVNLPGTEITNTGVKSYVFDAGAYSLTSNGFAAYGSLGKTQNVKVGDKTLEFKGGILTDVR